MKSRKDTLLVASPFQLLCAMEWSRVENPDSIIFLRQVNNEDPKLLDEIIKNFGQGLDIRKIASHNLPTFFLSLGYLVYMAARRRGHFLVGDIFSSRFIQKLYPFLLFNRKYLMDDGVGTLAYQNEIDQCPYKFHLYTIFDQLASKAQPNQEIKINELTLIQAGEQAQQIDHAFAGTSISGVEIIGAEVYFEDVCRLAKSVGKLAYFPHRNFNKQMMDRLRDVPEIELQEVSMPMELHLAMNHLKIKRFYTHFSSASFTLKKIQLIEQVVFLVNQNLWDNLEVRNIYQSAEEMFAVEYWQEGRLSASVVLRD